jgi:hypothetical protein
VTHPCIGDPEALVEHPVVRTQSPDRAGVPLDLAVEPVGASFEMVERGEDPAPAMPPVVGAMLHLAPDVSHLALELR